MALPASNRRGTIRRKNGQTTRLPLVPSLRHERPLWDEGLIVAGVDEVGRGAWAGGTTYAAVVLPTDRRMYKLRDSKQLDEPRREELSARLHAFALDIGIGHATNVEIDQVGLSDAIRMAARRAVDALTVRPDVLLIDGNWDFLAGYGTRNELIVHGDAHSASIAAASIVAKVARDRQMIEAADVFRPYDFASNKGYPSPRHVDALRQMGPCRLHRHTWAPVASAAGTAPVEG